MTRPARDELAVRRMLRCSRAGHTFTDGTCTRCGMVVTPKAAS